MSDIIGPAAAKTALDALIVRIRNSIAAAKVAGKAAYDAAINAAQADLEEFWNNARPSDELDNAEFDEVQKIKEIAFDLRTKLSVDQMEGNVQELKRGAEKLEALGASLATVTGSNERAAKSIALDPIKKAVDSMTALVNSVKSLKANLTADDPDEAKAITEIEKLVEQFEALQDAVTGDA